MEQTDLFGTEKISKILLKLAPPVMLAQLIQALYNIIDSLFVGRYSDSGLTALSIIYPLQLLMIALAVGTGVGINTVMAAKLGVGNEKEADEYAGVGTPLAGFMWLLFAIICWFAMPFYAKMSTNSEVIIHDVIVYGRIVCVFSFGLFLESIWTKVLQSCGDMKTPMTAQIIGAITNIVLDPLLIFGIGFLPRLGIAGAALATGIGQIVTLSIYLVVYFSRPLPVHIRRCYLKPHGATDKKLYAIGVPAILNLALPSLLVSFLNALLAGFSQSYVVVLGIYYKLQTFLYLPANGIIQGMRPIIGYNYGAREMKRVKKIYDTTLAMTAAMMLAGTLGCLFAAKPLIALFTANPETIALGTRALHIICLGFIVSAVSVTASGALEGLGKGFSSFIISLLLYVAVIIPAAFILCHTAGPAFVWHAFWITETLTAVVATFVYRQASK